MVSFGGRGKHGRGRAASQDFREENSFQEDIRKKEIRFQQRQAFGQEGKIFREEN